MSYSALQDTPINVNVLQQANDTGWSIDGTIATHATCNSGRLTLLYPISSGTEYSVVFQVLSISGGYVQLTLGGVDCAQVTTAGYHSFTVTAGSGASYLFSNAACQVTNFALQIIPAALSPYQRNTIAYSDRSTYSEDKTDKWGAWYTFVPDIARSLFENTYLFNQGALYVAQQGSDSRCNFFGQQFPATIRISTNEQNTAPKTFLSLNYQANSLLVTAPSGINTSLGQQSELIASDFEQAAYIDGSVVYSVEGVYQANLLRDMNQDIINGDQLKGNWMTVSLQTASPSSVLNLYTTQITYARSYANTR